MMAGTLALDDEGGYADMFGRAQLCVNYAPTDRCRKTQQHKRATSKRLFSLAKKIP